MKCGFEMLILVCKLNTVGVLECMLSKKRMAVNKNNKTLGPFSVIAANCMFSLRSEPLYTV